MSKRFVIANAQIYDMYSLSNTDLRTKDGCLYRLDRCIGVIYEELDSIELKAKAWDMIKPFIKVYLTDISADSNPLGIEEHAIRLIMDCSSRDEESIKLMTKALEVENE